MLSRLSARILAMNSFGKARLGTNVKAVRTFLEVVVRSGGPRGLDTNHGWRSHDMRKKLDRGKSLRKSFLLRTGLRCCNSDVPDRRVVQHHLDAVGDVLGPDLSACVVEVDLVCDMLITVADAVTTLAQPDRGSPGGCGT